MYSFSAKTETTSMDRLPDAAGTEGRGGSLDLRSLTLSDLTSRSITDLPTDSGVYALCQNGTPLYVGRSVNIRRRFQQHLRDPKKAAWIREIDEVRVFLLEGGSDPLLVAETGLILLLRPRYCKAIKLGVANDGHLYELQFVRGRRS